MKYGRAEIVVGLDPDAHVVTDCMPRVCAGISATVLGLYPVEQHAYVRQVDLRRH